MRAASTLLKRLKTVLVDSLSTRQTDKHNNHNFRPGHVPCPSSQVKLLSIRDSAVLLEWLGLALRKMRFNAAIHQWINSHYVSGQENC